MPSDGLAWAVSVNDGDLVIHRWPDAGSEPRQQRFPARPATDGMLRSIAFVNHVLPDLACKRFFVEHTYLNFSREPSTWDFIKYRLDY